MRIYKLLFISMVAVLMSAPFAHSADVAKIGIVDFQKIVEESEPGKKAKAEINTKGKKMEGELKKKAAEIEEMKKQLEREALVMSTEKREQNERDFRIKVNDFKGLQKRYEQDLQRLQKKVISQLQRDVVGLTKEIGKKGGFQLILEKSGVLYVPESLDITDQVVAEYNKKGLKMGTEDDKSGSQ